MAVLSILVKIYGFSETCDASLCICAIAERPHQPMQTALKVPLPPANITPLPISKNAATISLPHGKTADIRQVTEVKNTILADTDNADVQDAKRASVKDIFLKAPSPRLFFERNIKEEK